jgi:hypothetical protein
MYVSNFVEETTEEDPMAPLDLVLCSECSLLQLNHEGVEPEVLYKNYWYRSGVNDSMVEALKDITDKVEQKVALQPEDIVLDIGANDGTLLAQYTVEGLVKAAFEPAENLLAELLETANMAISDVFNAEAYMSALDGKRAKVVTSIAMFYDLEHPNEFVKGIKEVLAEDGLWVIQMSYLPAMLKTNAFDNICHEHLEYYSLTSLENLLEPNGMKVVDVEENDVNGGSFRIYVAHKENGNREESTAVKLMREAEKQMGLDTLEPYEAFAARVEDIKDRTLRFMDAALSEGRTICVYGASTKGNTLLQFYGLDHRDIKFAAERSEAKYGLKTVGSNIPIVSEGIVRELKPDYLLILPWHFLEGFVEREKEYLKEGQFIVPLPDFMVI